MTDEWKERESAKAPAAPLPRTDANRPGGERRRAPGGRPARDGKPGEKRFSKPGAKPFGKPGAKAFDKPGEKRFGKPGAKPIGMPGAKPVGLPGPAPGVSAGPRPVRVPMQKTAGTPVSKPAGPTPNSPTPRPAGQFPIRPLRAPGIKLAPRPGGPGPNRPAPHTRPAPAPARQAARTTPGLSAPTPDPLAQAKLVWQPAMRWCQKELKESKLTDPHVLAAVRLFHTQLQAIAAAKDAAEFQEAQTAAKNSTRKHQFLRWAPVPAKLPTL